MQLRKKALVIGLGISGCAAVRFLRHSGYQVAAYDDKFCTQSVELPDSIALLCSQFDVKLLHLKDVNQVQEYSKVVISPGIPHQHPFYAAAVEAHVELIGEVELAIRSLPQSHIVLGITGTNGKTSVTRFVEHLLRLSGKPATAVGNVGTAIIDHVHKPEATGIFVTELSSYQLETMTTQAIDQGVILNIMPNHLDRYNTMDDYAQAKCRLQYCLKPGGDLFVEERVVREYGHLLDLAKIKTFGLTSQANLYLEHNQIILDGKVVCTLHPETVTRPRYELLNFLAAYSLVYKYGITAANFVDAIMSFTRPPHRLEFVEELDGVKYYDDSKATSVAAVIEAVNALQEPIVLIAGGIEKGAPYTDWINAFQNKVRKIYAIGQAAPRILQEVGVAIPVEISPDMQTAVEQASLTASNGWTVLLSPGGSSFDQFRDYAHRGDVFKECVHSLNRKQLQQI
ncbi:MAG: murD [Chlamydiales bacterium]|jgi:UDP-N-acetylmuramoylalanine--D-glutamate ligase|nr:murD [Chlamydiales bacterium]